jgi:predicted esterase
MAEDPLGGAIELIRAGKIEPARQRLELVIKNDRNNVLAWHWYAQTWPNARDKARIWQACLRFNPGNERAQQALRDLNLSPEKQPGPAARIPAAATPPRKAKSSTWFIWASMGLLVIVAIYAGIVIRGSAPKDPQQYKHVQPVEYYLYVPKAYSADQEWPLFVGIHGAGGNGLQCWDLWQSHAEKEGFILLCPSIPGDPNGFRLDVGETTVWSAINEVDREYRLKPRIFFSGFSAGAFFVQGFTYHYPRAVSGLAILSSGLYLDPKMFVELVPMVVVIGDRDDPSAVADSRFFVQELQGYGFDVQYKVLPRVGHTVTRDGVNLTLELFRRTIGK